MFRYIQILLFFGAVLAIYQLSACAPKSASTPTTQNISSVEQNFPQVTNSAPIPSFDEINNFEVSELPMQDMAKADLEISTKTYFEKKLSQLLDEDFSISHFTKRFAKLRSNWIKSEISFGTNLSEEQIKLLDIELLRLLSRNISDSGKLIRLDIDQLVKQGYHLDQGSRTDLNLKYLEAIFEAERLSQKWASSIFHYKRMHIHGKAELSTMFAIRQELQKKIDEIRKIEESANQDTNKYFLLERVQSYGFSRLQAIQFRIHFIQSRAKKDGIKEPQINLLSDAYNKLTIYWNKPEFGISAIEEMHLIKQKRENIAELSAQEAKLRKELDAVGSSLRSLEAKKTAIHNSGEKISQDQQRQLEAIRAEEQRLQKIRDEITAQQTSHNQIQSESEILEEKKAQLQRENEELINANRKLLADREKLDAELGKMLTNKNNEYKAKVEGKLANIKSLDEQIKFLKYQMLIEGGLDNSYSSIRVFVFPNMRRASKNYRDDYPKTNNPNSVSIKSKYGLAIHILEGSAADEKNSEKKWMVDKTLAEGFEIDFDFSNPKQVAMTINKNKKINFEYSENERLWIVPLNNEDMMEVDWSQQISYFYKGQFVVDRVPSSVSSNEKIWGLINWVGMEQYLMNVVYSEMPLSYSNESGKIETRIEALKAQAIASRTYAYSKMFAARKSGRAWDLDPTIRFQSYKGANFFHSKSSQAVYLTEGMVIVDNNNKPIDAMFHAHSGGRTAAKKDFSYLQSVSDAPGVNNLRAYSKNYNEDLIHWEREMNLSDIFRAAGKEKDFKNIVQMKVELLKDKISLRPIALVVKQGEKTIFDLDQAELYRYVENYAEINFWNRLYTVKELRPTKDKKDLVIVFAGKGYGHGYGMSQWGAFCFALSSALCGDTSKGSYTANQILQHFYPNTEIKSIQIKN